MGKQSRDKGSRFERTVAKKFSDAFKMNIRRTPLSGGHSIRSDLYCPEDDSFRYFVECKHHKTFRFDSLIDGNSPLYEFCNTALSHSAREHTAEKYSQKQVPLVVFTGGNFHTHYVLLRDEFMFTPYVDPYLVTWGHVMLTLKNFLYFCNKSPLQQRKLNLRPKIILQEDDGEY